MSAFHALHVYVIYANTLSYFAFSRLAFSCPAISRPAFSAGVYQRASFSQ